MPNMTKIERINAALKGEQVDRIPISFWRHFYHQERDPDLLADALLAFQREYKWDFMKVNPRASYHVEGWGNRYRYGDDPHASPIRVSHAVHTKEDWGKIGVLDIWATDSLKQQLVLLELIREGLQDENVYFLQTIFSPLAIAFRLAGHSKERLAEAMENEAEQLEGALDAITETFVNYANASIHAGAAGLFFAVTKLASRDEMTLEQYERFGTPYDLRVLDAVRGRPGFNMLHMCGDNIFFDSLMGYPVDSLSWDASLPGNPGLGEGRQKSGKMVVGGLNQRETLDHGTPEQVAKEVERGVQETGGKGYVIAPGCTFPTTTNRDLLEAALAARDRYS
jgi:uroporphyrinogen decarboxylase